jgi:hypothetical protein
VFSAGSSGRKFSFVNSEDEVLQAEGDNWSWGRTGELFSAADFHWLRD